MEKLIKRYTPVFCFHEDESFFPISVDEFLSACKMSVSKTDWDELDPQTRALISSEFLDQNTLGNICEDLAKINPQLKSPILYVVNISDLPSHSKVYPIYVTYWHKGDRLFVQYSLLFATSQTISWLSLKKIMDVKSVIIEFENLFTPIINGSIDKQNVSKANDRFIFNTTYEPRNVYFKNRKEQYSMKTYLEISKTISTTNQNRLRFFVSLASHYFYSEEICERHFLRFTPFFFTEDRTSSSGIEMILQPVLISGDDLEFKEQLASFDYEDYGNSENHPEMIHPYQGSIRGRTDFLKWRRKEKFDFGIEKFASTTFLNINSSTLTKDYTCSYS